MHAQNLNPILRGIRSIPRHKVRDANPQLLLDQFVPQSELFLQVIYVVVPLLYVKLRPILLPLEIDLLKVE